MNATTQVLKSYLRRLTNIGGGSKSLLMRRCYAQKDIDFKAFDYLDKRPASQLLNDVIARKRAIKLCTQADARNEHENQVARTVQLIRRTALQIEEEQGSKDLYVGYPIVQGRLPDDTIVRAPLIFFPVEITTPDNHYALRYRSGENIVFNKTFLLAYAHSRQMPADNNLLDANLDDLGTDVVQFKLELYNMLKNSSVTINFNRDLFGTELEDFVNLKADDLKHQTQTGVLKLYPQAVLGMFPQADSYLMPDYEVLIRRNDLVKNAFKNLPDAQPDAPVKEEQLHLPFETDASQYQALRHLKQGLSQVVQGPPGTGKSQFICNVVADALSTGKRVLVVCQKRAALDVVYQRLSEKNLNPFVGLVHDFKADRKAIYEKMASQIKNIEAYKATNNSLDAIYLERTFLQASRRADQITHQLESLRLALYDTDICGVPAKELYLNSNPNAPALDLADSYTAFKFDQLPALRVLINDFADYIKQLDGPDYPLRNRISYAGRNFADLRQLKAIMTDVHPLIQQNAQRLQEVLGIQADAPLHKLAQWQSHTPQINQMAQLLTPQVLTDMQYVLQALPDLVFPEDELQHAYQLLNQAHGFAQLPNAALNTPVPQLLSIVKQAMADAANTLGQLKWKMWAPERKLLKALLHANGLTKTQLDVLCKKLENTHALQQTQTKWQQHPLLKNAPLHSGPAALHNWAKHLQSSLEYVQQWQNCPPLNQVAPLPKANYHTLKNKLLFLQTAPNDAYTTLTRWQQWLADDQIAELATDPNRATQLCTCLDRDFDMICELDNLRYGGTEQQKQLLQKLEKAYRNNPETDLFAYFYNGLAISWLNHIENLYPILRSVSSKKTEQLERDLAQQIKTKQQVSAQIVLMKAREQTYIHMQYNRMGNAVTYRDLNHEVNKQRRIWPLRKLLKHFPSDTYNLIPCWMASPEAVSALFPFKEIFDIVVFDEASQCYAEKGIPAAFRGKQLVVAGDSKQLKPNNLYQSRWEDHTENPEPETEIDSMLDLSARYLMQTQLTGHYRSQSLDLIDFSNRHFYNNTLHLIPAFDRANNPTPGIKYIKLNGTWGQKTNPTEAQAVTEMVVKAVETAAQTGQNISLGVVTFNAPQQQLITDKIEANLALMRLNWPDGLFVKNIENVQGDERDHIIFSIGYAPDAAGRMTMQFGSLNAIGGENRLNVAVTRARQQITVVTSILPTQLDVENTAHPGPKMLKAYLAYALDVSEGRYQPQPQPLTNHNPLWLLKQKLQKTYPHLKAEMPFADLTLKKENQYLGLLLTDDDLYYASPTARQPHLYLTELLKARGWPYKRIYSRNYWLNNGIDAQQIEF